MATHRRRRKWIWGCTGGCLGFLLVVGALVLGAGYYIARPMRVVPAETFVPPDGCAFLVMRITADDPLMVDIGARLAMSGYERAALPTKDGGVFSIDAETARKNVTELAPIQVVLTGSVPTGQQEFEKGAVISFRRYWRFYGMIVRSLMKRKAKEAGLPIEPYRGGTIGPSGRGGFIAVRGNNCMWAGRRETCARWIDRLAEERRREKEAGARPLPPPAIAAPPSVQAAYARLDPRAPVRFVAADVNGGLRLLFDRISDEQTRQLLRLTGITADNVRSAAGEIRSLNERDAAVSLYIECISAEAARHVADSLNEAAGKADEGNPLHELRATLEGEALVRIRTRIDDLPQKVSAMLGMEENAGPAPQGEALLPGPSN